MSIQQIGTIDTSPITDLRWRTKHTIRVERGNIQRLLGAAASAIPLAAVGTPGATLPLMPVFYLGCLPAALAGAWLPEKRWSYWAGVMVAWAALWLVLVSLTI